MFARLCVLGAVLAIGCTPKLPNLGGGDTPLERVTQVKCPPERVAVQVLDFPEYEGRAFGRNGVRKLLKDAKAASDSRDEVIRLWEKGWENCS